MFGWLEMAELERSRYPKTFYTFFMLNSPIVLHVPYFFETRMVSRQLLISHF